MDPLNRFFACFDVLKDRASWRAVFGDPYSRGNVTVIPVASVRYGMGAGMGFQPTEAMGGEGSPPEPDALEKPAGGGGLGGTSHPVAIIEVTENDVKVRPILQYGPIILAGIFTACWIVTLWVCLIRKYLNLREEA